MMPFSWGIILLAMVLLVANWVRYENDSIRYDVAQSQRIAALETQVVEMQR